MARRLLTELGGKQENFMLIGDTIHDYEVAKGSGIDCVLVANGHQSFEKLKGLDCRVLADIKEILSVFR
jgi:phosphoglycolate phosphatase